MSWSMIHVAAGGGDRILVSVVEQGGVRPMPIVAAALDQALGLFGCTQDRDLGVRGAANWTDPGATLAALVVLVAAHLGVGVKPDLVLAVGWDGHRLTPIAIGNAGLQPWRARDKGSLVSRRVRHAEKVGFAGQVIRPAALDDVVREPGRADREVWIALGHRHTSDGESPAGRLRARGRHVRAVFDIADVIEAALDLHRLVRTEEFWVGRNRGAGEAALFDVVMARRELPAIAGYRLVAEACRGLLGTLDDEHPAQRLEFARDVARRHCGDGDVLLSWDETWLAQLDAITRLEVAAHIVQSASDADLDVLGDHLAVAEKELAAPVSAVEREPAHRRLRGAVGRALAARGHFEQAEAVLAETAREWIAVGEAHEASYALCEWLRVIGIRGDRGEVDRLAGDEYRACLAAPRTSDISRAFLVLALGRAQLAAGDAEGALATLAEDAATWPSAHEHVRTARLRVQQAARFQLGLTAEADSCLEELASTYPLSADRFLAQVDRALALGLDPEPLLRALLYGAFDGGDLRRLLRRIAPDELGAGASLSATTAAKAAREYRY